MKNERITNEELLKIFKEKHPFVSEFIVSYIPYGNGKATIVLEDNEHFHIEYDEEKSLFVISE